MVASLFNGCKGNEIYPIVPAIEFKQSYVANATQIVLTFTYKDGDGDIGLNASDTFPPFQNDTLGPNKSLSNRFYNNIFIDYYGKFNGEYFKIVLPNTNDTINRDVRVGNLTPEGNHKAIRGEIKVNVLPIIYAPDSFKLKVRLVDRALNVSNEVETPDMVLIR